MDVIGLSDHAGIFCDLRQISIPQIVTVNTIIRYNSAIRILKNLMNYLAMKHAMIYICMSLWIMRFLLSSTHLTINFI